MRTFIAIEAGTREVETLLEKIPALGKGVKPGKPLGLHLTLKFLGEIPESKVPAVHQAMGRAFSTHEPFEISLKGVGVFPNPKRPRVIWAGVMAGRDTLIDMQSALDRELEEKGFEREKRSYHPHLTLARVKSPRAGKGIRQFMEDHKDRDFGRIAVTDVKLIKSDLTPQGAIYTTLATVRL